MTINQTKIKAIIFDWGGVCCQEGEPFSSRALQETLGLTPKEIAEKAQSIYLGYYQGQYNGEIFWQKIINFFNLRMTADLAPHFLSQAYLNSYSVYPEILALVAKLKERYPVGLLSNLTPEMRDWIIAKHQLKKIFSTQVYSCDPDVAALKPDPKPYLIICQKLKVEPNDCLFIDNSPKNIKAAQALGMQTILFSNPLEFLKEIEILYE